MIKHMTPSHVIYEYNGRTTTILGEPLVGEVAGKDFVLYADTLEKWDPPNDTLPMSTTEKITILEGVKIGLADRAIRFDVEGEESIYAEAKAKNLRIAANQLNPQAGWYFTPSKVGSRRYFKKDELMPKLQTDYGDTYWLWDADQTPPKL
jgi:Immunity protein 74